MRYATRLVLAAAAVALLAAAGCGISFPDEEMNPASTGKLRPLGVVFAPAEAHPGETVTASFHFYTPDPEAYAAEWSVALDYGIGLYETDEYELGHVPAGHVIEPEIDEDGFGTQLVSFVVPTDLLLTASSRPEVVEDELILEALRGILPAGGDGPVAAAELNALIGSDEIWTFTPAERDRLRYVADLFSCEVRLRGSLSGVTTVDVTRNLTVRWSRYHDTLNVNENPTVNALELIVADGPDVAWGDVDLSDPDTYLYPIIVPDPGTWGPVTLVEARDDKTYWLRCRAGVQMYSSPFDPFTPLEEDIGILWYQHDVDRPDSGHPLFVTDGGDPAEMFDLDEAVRIKPPTGVVEERPFRIMVVVRDRRWEWGQYSSAPGTIVEEGAFRFIPPED